MIAVVDVAVQAANVSMPLFPWRAFRNSYSSVRVRNVPRKIGKWNITNVTVQVTYPDGSIKTADAVLTGGVWVATVEGTATAGTSLQGYKILASGIDENGQPVSNYCLGRGDVTILEDDGELIPANVITYTRLLSAEPTSPKDGDLWQLSGTWYIYQDGTSYPIGDDSGLITQLSAELSSKQDKLSDAQISAIDSVVDERATIFDFGNGDISALNLFGEITVQELIDAGIHAEDDTWIKDPVSVKLGTAVTGIDEYAFFTAMYMTNIILPNNVTHIDASAFQECHALSSITIPESVESVGAYAFDACYNLTSIIVKGKTQSEAETMFADACVSPSIIKTWNDASQEWVEDQGYLSAVPATYKTYNDTLSSLSSDGYATTTYAVHNLSGVANITSMPLSSYESISATADAETLYVITED